MQDVTFSRACRLGALRSMVDSGRLCGQCRGFYCTQRGQTPDRGYQRQKTAIKEGVLRGQEMAVDGRYIDAYQMLPDVNNNFAHGGTCRDLAVALRVLHEIGRQEVEERHEIQNEARLNVTVSPDVCSP